MEWLMSNLTKLLGVLALVLTNGFFVSAELALVKIRDTQIETLVLKGHRRAKIVQRLIRNLDTPIGAIQFGIPLVSRGLGVLVEPVFQALLAPIFPWLHVIPPGVQHPTA